MGVDLALQGSGVGGGAEVRLSGEQSGSSHIATGRDEG